MNHERQLFRFEPRALEYVSEPMLCRGCGAKMGAIALQSAINTALGSDANEGSCEIAIEDAVEIGMEAGQPLIASNDFLTSPFHDAFLNGRIAALILVSGPRFALSESLVDLRSSLGAILMIARGGNWRAAPISSQRAGRCTILLAERARRCGNNFARGLAPSPDLFAFRCQEFGYSDRSGRVIKAHCNFRWLAQSLMMP